MAKYPFIVKGFSIGIILLFIGVAFAPSINIPVVKASSEDERVDLNVEFCGLGKKYTIQLAQKEVDEIEKLFDDLEQRLFKIKTKAEAEVIFKSAIVELNKLGLLGNLNIEQVENLIFKKNKYTRFEKFLQKDDFFNITGYGEEYLCLVAGNTDNTFYIGGLISVCLVPASLIFLWCAFLKEGGYDTPLLDFLLSHLGDTIIKISDLLTIIGLFSPIAILNIFCAGVFVSDEWIANGWIFSVGLTGLNGQREVCSAGCGGFTGIKIYTDTLEYYYLGFAPYIMYLPIW